VSHGAAVQFHVNLQVHDLLPVARGGPSIDWHTGDVIFVSVPKATTAYRFVSETLVGVWSGQPIVFEAGKALPEGAKKGVSITIGSPAVTVIHAGTRKQDGRWLTNGGRVLNLATSAPDLATARAAIEAALPQVNWPGRQARRDIGLKALKPAQAGKTVQDPW